MAAGTLYGLPVVRRGTGCRTHRHRVVRICGWGAHLPQGPHHEGRNGLHTAHGTLAYHTDGRKHTVRGTGRAAHGHSILRHTRHRTRQGGYACIYGHQRTVQGTQRLHTIRPRHAQPGCARQSRHLRQHRDRGHPAGGQIRTGDHGCPGGLLRQCRV